jgi:hypothetical protein
MPDLNLQLSDYGRLLGSQAYYSIMNIFDAGGQRWRAILITFQFNEMARPA